MTEDAITTLLTMGVELELSWTPEGGLCIRAFHEREPDFSGCAYTADKGETMLRVLEQITEDFAGVEDLS